MSLSDYIKYQRALKGGLTPWEIAEGSGVQARDVHLIEVKHRRMGEDDALLEKLATFFSVPPSELTSRREAFRKRLTFFLDENRRQNNTVVLRLESGEDVRGNITWFSREAVALVPEGSTEDELYIVQRAWVANWRHIDANDWDVRAD